MQRALIRLAAAVLAGALLGMLAHPALLQPSSGWVRLLVVVLVACAAGSPGTSLLILAAGIPIAGAAVGFAGVPLRMVDLLVCACAAGWSLRCLVRPDALRSVPAEILRPVLLLAAIACASGLVELIVLRGLIGPQPFREAIVSVTRYTFFTDRGPLQIVNGAILVLESLAVLCASAAACARSPAFRGALVRIITAGAAAAAIHNLTRVAEIALRSPTPLAAAWDAIRSLRINTAYSDVNAAGSFFAMSAIVALAAVHSTTGRWKAVPSLAVAILIAATWVTGSRAAVAAVLLACLGLLAIRLRRGAASRAVGWGFALCAAGMVAFATVFANPLTGSAATIALFVRQEMARISFRMLMADPWFGVGIGRFYAASGPWIESSPLAAFYRNENAHNTALQWMAESGLVGSVAAAWFLLAVLRMARRHARTERSALFDYLAVALLAFAATALFGHPLLTAEVSLSAALVLGLLIGTSYTSHAAKNVAAGRGPRLLLAAAILGIFVLTPWRVRRELARAPLEHVAWGVSGWQTDAAGERYRRMTGPATLFIPTRSGWAEVPYRLEDGSERTVLLLTFRGRPADRLVLQDYEWHRYVIRVARAKDSPEYEPLEIRVVEGAEAGVLLGKVIARGRSD